MKLRERFRATLPEDKFWDGRGFTVVGQKDDLGVRLVRFTDGHETEVPIEDVYEEEKKK